MKVIDAARMLNVYPESIRIGLQTGRYPFGVAVKREKSKCWNYIIIKSKFDEYLEMQKKYKR